MLNEILQNEQFTIHFPIELREFIHKSIDRFNDRNAYIKSLFDNQLTNIKVSVFNSREEFTTYIKSISKNTLLLNWTNGCCCNNEIQILVESNDEKILKHKSHILTHEMTHLYFNNFIYKKYNIKRIRWFDESYASYIDGRIQQKTIGDIKEKATNLKKFLNFNMNELSSLDTLNQIQNPYDMFLIIGKYIFDNHLQSIYIEKLISNRDSIIEIGKHILKSAIKHALKN